MHEPTEVAEAARAILARVMSDRLTETETRRVRLLYGLEEGRERSERQVAREEGVVKYAVQLARDAALEKLEGDWRMWLLSLLVDAQPARWFDCDHCKNDCGYGWRADADVVTRQDLVT